MRGGKHKALEGTARDRHVIIEFDSYEQAFACYESPEYQATSQFRHASAMTDLVIIQGVV